MIEFNLNTGAATNTVPSDTTTNMSYQQQNSGYGYYGQPVQQPMYQQTYGYFGQPVQPGYGPIPQPGGYTEPQPMQQQSAYGYFGQPVQQYPNYEYGPQPMYQQPGYGYFGQPVSSPMTYPYTAQPMNYQPMPVQQSYGYFGQPVQEQPPGRRNDFLNHPDMQRFMREHELDPQDPDDFFVLKTQAQSIGLNTSNAHEPGIKTWEFMAKPKPFMMPNDPTMDPRSSSFNMGVGGMGYNMPDPRYIPYNGGQPFYQRQYYQEPVDQVVHVDGLKMPGSQFLIPEDIKERIAKMQADMIVELEEEAVKRQKRSQGVFNANPYYSYGYDTFNWENQRIISKYYKMIDELVEECRQKRSKFNRDLVKMARHMAGDDISDEELDVMFNGYDYTIPRKHYEGLQEYAYLQRFIPVDDTYNPYYQHALDMKKLYEEVYGPDVKGNDRFMTHTSLIDDYYAAEESRRRKLSYGTNGMFNGTQYLHQLRRNIEQRMAEDPEYHGYGAENTRDKINIFDQDIMNIPTKLQDEMERKISGNYKQAPTPNDVWVDPKTLPPLQSTELKTPEQLNAEYDARIDNIMNNISDIKNQLMETYEERKQAFYNALHD